jgi:hypothetical protein
MFRPMTLNLEDVVRICGKGTAEEFYYQSGAEFSVSREQLLECNLMSEDREAIQSIPKQTRIKLKNVYLGTYNIVLA